MNGVVFGVEAWTVSGDEEPCEEEMVESAEFEKQADAMYWAWNRMEEGYAVRLWRR